MSDRIDRRPLYRRIRDLIAEEIAKNTWRPGERIPTEAELGATYEAAGGTIGRALDLLEDDGLIERVHGSGTFVRRPNFQTAIIRSAQYYGCASDVRTPRSRILEREALPGPRDVTTALCLDEDAQVIRLKRLRIYDGLPVLVECIWLDEARFAPILTMEDDQQQLLYPIYESLCGEVVARIEETLTIDVADNADAELLGIGPGRPIAVIERLAFGYDGHPLEWRCSRGPASDLRYKISIR